MSIAAPTASGRLLPAGALNDLLTRGAEEVEMLFHLPWRWRTIS